MLLHVIDDPVYWSATWIIVEIIFSKIWQNLIQCK